MVFCNFFSGEMYFFDHNIKNVIVHICTFSSEHYHDNLYEKYDIFLPKQIEHSVIKRKMEYLAGRYSANVAIQKITMRKFQILIGENRVPLFPVPLKGSISHSQGIACCAVTKRADIIGIGVDIEEEIDNSTIEQISKYIISDYENQFLLKKSISYNLLFTTIFSAKESIFKALYKEVGYYFDFDCVVLRHIKLKDKILVFEVDKDLSSEFQKRKVIYVKFYYISDKVLTIAII